MLQSTAENLPEGPLRRALDTLLKRGAPTQDHMLNLLAGIERIPSDVAGRLRIRVLEPASATLSVHAWSDEDPQEFRRGWRVDVSGGQSGYTVELSEK